LNEFVILRRLYMTYGSEAWTLCKEDESRIEAAEWEFMRRTVGYT